MRLRFSADLSGLDLREDYLKGERAVTQAMAGAARTLKKAWRGDVVGAGLGRRLGNTIRGQHYPTGTESMNAAALVWTRAPKIVAAHNAGPLIRSREGFWLAIPTEAAGQSRRRGRITPYEWERRRGTGLRFVYRRGRSALLVADDARITSRGLAVRRGGRRRRDGILTGAQTVPIFVLVPQVKLPKRLDLDTPAERVAAGLSGAIRAGWAD